MFTKTANEIYVQVNILLIPGSLVTFPNVLSFTVISCKTAPKPKEHRL